MHQQTRLVLTWITPRVWTQLPACLSHSSYPHACEPNTCGSAALRLSGLRGVGSLAKSTNHLHSLVEMKRDHREDWRTATCPSISASSLYNLALVPRFKITNQTHIELNAKEWERERAKMFIESFKVESPNVKYTENEIHSVYDYETTEVVHENRNGTYQWVVKPKTVKYDFKTDTRVPKLG